MQLTNAHIYQLTAMLQHYLSIANNLFILPPYLVNFKFTEVLQAVSIVPATDVNNLGRFLFLCDIELDLLFSYKHTIGGVAWINENHSTFFILNIKNFYLNYGGSNLGS